MNQLETQKEINASNLEQLRSLVNELEQQELHSDSYDTTLRQIQRVIREEQKIISNLKKSDIKIKHYETICNSIMSIITAARI